MIAELVQAADRERWLSTLYAPEAVRPALLAVHALDLELAKVVATTTDAMLGEIRLAWWRERLQGLDRGEVPAEPILQALSAEVLPRGVTGETLAGMEDGWLTRLSGADDAGALRQHAIQRGAALFGALATLLGGDPAKGGQLGGTWAAGELARYEEAVVQLPRVRGRAPLGPLAGLAALGSRDLRRAAAGLPIEARATPVRQLVLLRAVVIGR